MSRFKTGASVVCRTRVINNYTNQIAIEVFIHQVTSEERIIAENISEKEIWLVVTPYQA